MSPLQSCMDPTKGQAAAGSRASKVGLARVGAGQPPRPLRFRFPFQVGMRPREECGFPRAHGKLMRLPPGAKSPGHPRLAGGAEGLGG